jgi:hypothetical protein
MRRMMQPRGLLIYGTVLAGLGAVLAAGVSAVAQTARDQAVMVSLVRQDFSDCQNGNVSDADPSKLGGTIWLARGSDGTTSVKVGITAEPDTTYHLFLKCVRLLGDIATGDEGTGTATFTFPTASVGSVFAFDMYPEGAPAGNKFQSVQVAFR